MSDIEALWNEGGPSGQGWSEVAALFRCPKEYELARLRGITVPTTKTPDYFFVGSAFHAGRAAWLVKGCKMTSEVDTFIDSEVQRIRAEYEAKLQPVKEQAVKDVTRYLAEYREHYSTSPAPKTVAVEHLLGPVDMSDIPSEGLMRTARLDDIGYYHEAGGGLCIGECKTGSGTPAQIINEYQLHGQPLLQWLLWEKASQGAAQYGAISAVVLDVVQKGYGGKRCTFGRTVITPTPFALKWYAKELAYKLRRASVMRELGEEGERNITSCAKPRLGPGGMMMGSCTYRNLCTFGEQAAFDYVRADGSPLTKEDCQ